MKKSVLLATGLLLHPGFSHADSSIPELVVTASRSMAPSIDNGASIQVIDRNEIINSNATNIVQLLRGRSGIHVSDLFGDGSNASIDMRGFGSTAGSNTLIMVDGRKLNPASDSATLYLNSINLDNVEQVEILHGSAGILYGNQAVGGVINIITRKPEDLEFQVSTGTGSYDGYSVSGRAGQRLDNGIGYRIQASKRDSGNYRDHSESELKQVTALLDYEHNDGRLFVEFNYLDEDVNTPGALFADEVAQDRRQSATVFADDFLQTRSNVTRVGLEHTLSDTWQLTGEVSYRDDERDFIQSFRAFGPGTLSTQDRETYTFSPRFIGRFDTTHGETRITTGIDFEDTDYLLVSSFGPQAAEQGILAWYGQAIYPFAKDWQLTAGIRHARIKNDIDDSFAGSFSPDDDVTVGSIGLSYRPSNQWRLYSRADQNYRFAKVDEHTNLVAIQPSGLKTQTGISYELGAEYNDHNYHLSARTYRLVLKDEISFDSSGFFNINLDKTRRQGLSLEGGMNPADNFVVTASYDYIDSEITSGPFKWNRIPLVPEHRARLKGEWFAQSGTVLGIEWVYTDDQVLGGDFSNSFEKLGSYTVVNLNARHKINDWSLSARINNLLNEKYSEAGAVGLDEGFSPIEGYSPAPERNLWITASYQFRD